MHWNATVTLRSGSLSSSERFSNLFHFSCINTQNHFSSTTNWFCFTSFSPLSSSSSSSSSTKRLSYVSTVIRRRRWKIVILSFVDVLWVWWCSMNTKFKIISLVVWKVAKFSNTHAAAKKMRWEKQMISHCSAWFQWCCLSSNSNHTEKWGFNL